MPVRIDEVTLTKSQKALRVRIGNQWYGAFLDSGLLELPKGTLIEVDITTDEKFGPQIRKWAKCVDQGAVAPHEPEKPNPSTGTGDNIPPWYMPFVSNLCAHAIQAGLIKDPRDLNQWALKAAQVAVAVKTEVGT